jgi:hypothetical protein
MKRVRSLLLSTAVRDYRRSQPGSTAQEPWASDLRGSGRDEARLTGPRDIYPGCVGLWNDQVFPRVMDRVLRTPEVNTRRAEACQGLHGRVLEIGFGTGLNLRHYPGDVSEILLSSLRSRRCGWRSHGKRLSQPVSSMSESTVPGSTCRTDRWIACFPRTRYALFRTGMRLSERFIACSSQMVRCIS